MPFDKEANEVEQEKKNGQTVRMAPRRSIKLREQSNVQDKMKRERGISHIVCCLRNPQLPDGATREPEIVINMGDENTRTGKLDLNTSRGLGTAHETRHSHCSRGLSKGNAWSFPDEKYFLSLNFE